METKVWEIDWDSIESRFVDGNYYDSRGGWDLIEPEFENPVIKELEARLNNDLEFNEVCDECGYEHDTDEIKVKQ
jgi:hypothetical protein